MERILSAFIVGLIITIFIVSCNSKNVSNNPKDSDIIQARSYLADFESRMEKVDKQIEICYNFSEMSRFNRCKASVYDSVGFDYDINTELSKTYKIQIELYKQIAFKPLTTE